MSQAFTKEGDAADDFPEKPVSDRPNYVTSAGLAELEAQGKALARRRAKLSQDDPSRKLVERDLRYVQARLASAILVPPPPADIKEARFGCVVEVEEGGARRRYAIVGEDEADPAAGKLAWSSPLALALMGAKAGDAVSWESPSGARRLDVVSVGRA